MQKPGGKAGFLLDFSQLKHYNREQIRSSVLKQGNGIGGKHSMNRVYNFSAGPSMLPESVLRRAADEMLDYHGCGQSVMEMSHRSKEYQG